MCSCMISQSFDSLYAWSSVSAISNLLASFLIFRRASAIDRSPRSRESPSDTPRPMPTATEVSFPDCGSGVAVPLVEVVTVGESLGCDTSAGGVFEAVGTMADEVDSRPRLES